MAAPLGWPWMPGVSRPQSRAVLAVAVFAVCVGGTVAADAVEGHGDSLRRARAVPPAARAWHHSESGDAALDLEAIRQTERRMPYVAVAGHHAREMALTFDDGPGPYTRKVLRVLRRMQVPATFFQIGSEIRAYPGTEGSLLADPLVVLGDHTESHPQLTRLSPEGQYSELRDAAGMMVIHHAPWPHLFRPPYGDLNRATLHAAHRLHMLTVLWTIDTNDWRRPGVDAIVRAVMAGARRGAIVLMHDGGGDRSQTVEALPIIIRQLRAERYRLVTVPRLLRDDPPSKNQPPHAGVG